MKDEIKEIIKNKKITNFNYDIYEKQLLDYITNLQEERNNMACLVNDLQEKIDEAIEYIKEHSNALGLLEAVDNKDLLNVLQGSDE